MDYKDYYTILGVPRTADEQTIKSAYRRLARTHHPDVNSDKAAATEKFKEINEAYTVLSDPDKRRTYDSFGARFEQYQRSTYRPAEPQRSSPYNTTGPRPASRTHRQQRTQTRTMSEEEFEQIFRSFFWTFGGQRSSSASSGDFSDFFEALFGNRWAGTQAGSRTAARPAPGRDIEMDLPVSLEEAFRGTTRSLEYADGRRIEVDIPRGVDNGTRLRIRGQGDKGLFGARGDLYLTIQVRANPNFTRRGDDLHVKVDVDPDTARQSGEVQVPTIERPVVLKVPANTADGQVFRLRGLGMPNLQNPTRRGDLLATMAVKEPPKPQSRPAAKPQPARRRVGILERLRGLTSVGLIAVGFLALVVQMLLHADLGWLMLAALAVTLLIQSVYARSAWLGAAGAAALASGAWVLARTGLAASSIPGLAWPLLPLAAGLLLLPRQPRRGGKSGAYAGKRAQAKQRP